ncbi:MAG: HlyD family secretion protein [Chitinophagaceae bacterium]|nr:HlyD family secretion protein [Chitinophagaceae bacterium]MEA3427416.1 HlyD family secretion protein [Bacteroidota bacterium]MCA6452598.1 HlyD family secretion protein [Chitinophagaceae bacterium]MCA6454847.1 HlyD family secretion protein [Chitinophagaceae bacterium]MCA6459260.1 HlyD family secretion protein [Chitinophagaceae bacterium]
MSQASNEKKSPVKLIVLVLALLVAGFYGYKKIHFALTHETTDNAQVETQITPVLPRVAGYVKHISVKDYDSVKAGELVVELDDAELQTQLLEMEADYRQAEVDIINAKAALNNAVVSLKVNKGNIELSQVRRKKAEDDLKRDQNLYAEQAITRKQLDDSKFNAETASQQLENSRTDLTAAQSRIAVLQAGVQKATAALDVKKAKIEQTKLKISYTRIFAPQAGRIGKKNVSEGQYVQAGTPLFSIVNDTTYWIVANFKENQLKKLYPGKEVDVEVDAFPDVKIKGTIESLSEATGAKFSLLPPDNASGNFVKVTQRVPVKILINNINQYHNMLRAGLSVYVSAEIH